MHRGLTLGVLCLCAFAVNVDTTIVNVALPTLTNDLGASTRELQWIVDAYNLTFAALVLAAGSLGDRFGRKGLLLIGLTVYGLGNALAALTDDAGTLIATRAVMGIGAAIVFPATLSIITNVFTERRERAQAIGLWGASTGIAVAAGPIAGGALIEAFAWPATFVAKVPLALFAMALVIALVPTSRDPETPPLDWAGLVLSTFAIGLLVFGIIEAPEVGWGSPETLGLLGASAVLLAAFVAWERRTPAPMLELSLFQNLRFSAASVSVTVSFFALFGFIFLVTQYFQFLKGYGPLETGLRILPVATAVAISSVLGTKLAVTYGNKLIVSTGLGCLAVGFAWISTASIETPYLEIAGQMLVVGSGMGLTSAPATESIMGAVSTAKAGVGSGVADATRELGGTLGVAIIGSVYASLYVDGFAGSDAPEQATESIGGALGAAERLAGEGDGAGAGALRAVAETAFLDGFQAGCLVAAAVCVAGAIFCAAVLPAQPRLEVQPEPAPTM